MELKRLDFKEGRFIANGKTYVIESMFTPQRWAMYQKIQIEAAYGVTFKVLYENINFAFRALNAGQVADVAVTLHNIMNGITKIEQREPDMLRMCALFINTPDEDRGVITDDQITEKIRDWEVSGYAIQDFFTLALNTIRGFVDVYKNLVEETNELQRLLNEMEAKRKPLPQ